MAYTNTWNESIPVGGAPANTVDDWLRQEKLDVRERMNSIMGYAQGNALTDPVIPAGAGMFAVQTLYLYIPVWGMRWVTTASTLLPPANDTAVGIDVVANTHTTGYFQCPIVLPVGVSIQPSLNYIHLSQSATSLVYDIKASKHTGLTVTPTVWATGSGSGAFVGNTKGYFGPAVAELTVADTFYNVSFYVTPPAGTTCTVLGVCIVYTSPGVNVRI